MSTTQREILGVSGRAVRWIMIFVLLSLATISCKDDKRECVPTPPPKEGNADVIFEINVPQSTVPSTYALDKEDEDQIKTIEILLFKINPNDSSKEYTGKPYYCDIINSGTGLNSANKHFIVSLPAGGAYDIVVLANSREVVNKLLVDTPPTVTAKDDLLKLLKIEHNTKWIADKNDLNYKPFPMWGELENETISPNLRFQTKMMRMLAKIDVTLSTPTAIASFKLKEVILVNAHTQGRIVPDKNNIALDGRVNKPTLVDGSIINVNKLYYTDATTANVGFVNTIYTFEAEGATPSTLSKATFIIVKGLYVADGKEYFYKLDLGEKKGDGTIVYHHILRNFQYSIGISRIGGAGYGTLDEAIAGPSSNIESTLVVWDNKELPIVVWDNDNALGFSTDDITLGYAAGASKPLKVMTDYTGGWKVDKIVDDFGAAVDWLTLSPMKSTAGKEISMEELEFTVTENTGTLARVCWVYVSAGALSHKVKVTQQKTPIRIGHVIWNDYDGETGVKTNDDGSSDVGFTKITVVDLEGNSHTSTTVSGGVVTPTLVVNGIASVMLTYKGYVLDVPVDKYTHTESTKTLTVTDRSLIGKAVHLNKVRDDLAGNYIQVSDVDLTSYANWVPIGTQPIPFTGSYTGGYLTNEFKIENLTINRPTENYVGLFGSASGATLTKIHIASGSVKGNIGVGAICGYNSNSAISGCTNAATVTGTSDNIGGICGFNVGTSSKITDCKNLSGGDVKGSSFVGGICGRSASSSSGDNRVERCTNAATVKGTGAQVGGICGYNFDPFSKIIDCKNLSGGDVSGVSLVGGICGNNNNGAIETSTNAATVTGTGIAVGTETQVGGIVGRNTGVRSKITNCENLSTGNVSGVGHVGGVCGYNQGTISSTTPNGTTNAATVTGNRYVGGICGSNYALISGSENSGTVTATGAGYAGGICGYNSGTVEESTNESLVEGKTGTTARIGGICGQNDNGGKILKCVNNAKVTTLGSYIGGICGQNIASSEISECTNTAIIEGRNSFVGGICGRSETTSLVTKCHNLEGANIIYAASNAGGICGGNLTGSTISGCTNAAVVNEETETGNQIGGICGQNYGEVSGCTSYATATVKGSTTGGICGSNYDAGTISVCINYAAVTGTGTNVGGIAGNSTGTISGCTNNAVVTGSGDNVGGISGKNTSTISGCINNATVTAIVTLKYIGGICGRSDGAAAKVTACINTGAVSGAGSSDVGGICGFSSGAAGVITNCKNLTGGNVLGTSNVGGICGQNNGSTVSGCTNAATVTGSFVGGICGLNQGSGSNITDCDNLVGGDVSGTDRLGGICALHNGGTILGCINAATVTAIINAIIGGICGENRRDIHACINLESATVSAGGGSIGGIAGSNNSTGLSACYNLASVTGTGTGVGAVIGVAYVAPASCYFGGNAEATFVNTAGSTRFGADDAWPNMGMTDWSEYDATNNPTGYWKSIGSWNGGVNIEYPQLYRPTP